MDLIKKFFYSNQVMKVVAIGVLLSMLTHSLILTVLSYGLWIVYLVALIKVKNYPLLRNPYIMNIVIAVGLLILNIQQFI